MSGEPGKTIDHIVSPTNTWDIGTVQYKIKITMFYVFKEKDNYENMSQNASQWGKEIKT